MLNNNLRKAFALTCIVSLAACSFHEKTEVKRLDIAHDGKKSEKSDEPIKVTAKDDELNITIQEDDSSGKKFIADYFSKLPKGYANKNWVRNNFVPSENISLNKAPSDYSRTSVGSAPKRGFEVTSQPIIAEGKIFTLGGQGELSARLLSGDKDVIWKADVEAEFLQKNRPDYDWLDDVESFMKDEDEFLGGNICYSRGRVFVSTKRGNVFAVEAKSGKVLWHKSLKSPVRSSPIASNNIIIVSTSDSKTYALNATTGKKLWEHEGGQENAKFVTAPTPLIIGKKVIVSYPSGEVFALNLLDGEEIWMAITSPERITQLLPTNNDISYTPVYSNGMIFVVSSNGAVFALDENSGSEVWQLSDKAIVNSPWAVGNYLFAINRYGQMYAISSIDGSVLWTEYLADPEDIDDDNLVFTPPIMAGNYIYVADNEGKLRSYSPANGKMVSESNISNDVYQQPVVVDGRMYFLSNNSDLVEVK